MPITLRTPTHQFHPWPFDKEADLADVPETAATYRLGNRSALEWTPRGQRNSRLLRCAAALESTLDTGPPLSASRRLPPEFPVSLFLFNFRLVSSR